MIPLTDLTPEAIRALHDDELRVRVAMVDGWQMDFPHLSKPGIVGATHASVEYISRDGWVFDWDEEQYAGRVDRVPNYPASYDAVLPVVRAWLDIKDAALRESLFTSLLPHRAKNGTSAADVLRASPRDLCVALLCAAREVGA